MSAYKPHARVAQRTPRRIDEVDGVPIPHIPSGWVHAWTVTDNPSSTPPPPFAAKTNIPATTAVPAMCAVVLIATGLALAVVLGSDPHALLIAVGCIGALVIWTLLLILPAFLRSRR